MKKSLMVFICLAFMMTSSFGFIVYDPINHIQNAITAANSVTSVMNQVRQIQNQLQAMALAIKNSHGVSQYQWQNTQQLIARLDQLSQQAHALSYAANNVDDQFQTVYSTEAQSTGSYNATAEGWHESTLATLRSSLDAVHANAAHYQQEESLLQSLVAQGQSAEGRMQALQVSTELSAETINQLQALKRVLDAEMSAQTSYMAYQVSKASYTQHSMHQIDQQLVTDFPTYHDNPAFADITVPAGEH